MWVQWAMLLQWLLVVLWLVAFVQVWKLRNLRVWEFLYFVILVMVTGVLSATVTLWADRAISTAGQ